MKFWNRIFIFIILLFIIIIFFQLSTNSKNDFHDDLFFEFAKKNYILSSFISVLILFTDEKIFLLPFRGKLFFFHIRISKYLIFISYLMLNFFFSYYLISKYTSYYYFTLFLELLSIGFYNGYFGYHFIKNLKIPTTILRYRMTSEYVYFSDNYKTVIDDSVSYDEEMDCWRTKFMEIPEKFTEYLVEKKNFSNFLSCFEMNNWVYDISTVFSFSDYKRLLLFIDLIFYDIDLIEKYLNSSTPEDIFFNSINQKKWFLKDLFKPISEREIIVSEKLFRGF